MSAAKNLSIRLAAVGGDKVRQEFKALGNDGQKAFRQITNVITPANDNLLKLNENTKVFNNILRQASYVAGAFLGFKGISGTLGALFESNRNFEQLSASLKTVIGSTENAQAAFTLIENFATATPYQLNEVVEAFIRLKALGLDPSEEALTSYGNTASAFSKNILDFVEAVADATVGEFERLKSFGIKANTLTNEVKFTFAGVTTTVKKNATDIEKYLRSLGDIKFARAMSEQMKTMNGVISNIEDNFDKIYRDIGKNGLNEALKSSLTQFNELVGQSGNAATVIGETLATAVEVASGAFFTLAENADIALGLIATRLGGSAISAGWVALSGSVTKLNGGMALLGTTSKSAIAGLTMMSQVSKMAAVQMALKGLDSTKSGYQQYKSDVERIYDDMIKKAEESALNSSKSLEDGFRRGFTSIREEAGNFANLAESTVKNAFSNMEDALTTFVTTGKASFSDFANAIISDLTRIIIRQSITQPLLNGIASYFGFATAHTGGIVGSDNLRKTYASPAVFFNAPKFHGGGIVGDEVPIIAKRGEGVFTREQMKAIGDRESTVNISVNVINNASSDVKTSVTKSNQGNGKINLDIMIEKIENSMAKNVSKGTGLAPVLERRYGLNPAYGSYG